MGELVILIVEQLLPRLPGRILKRWLPQERVAQQIDVSLRGQDAITIGAGGQVPSVDLYFEINNHSPLPLVLDRVIIDLWFGQPTVEGALLKRYDIPRHSKRGEILWRHFLNPDQQKRVEDFRSSSGARGRIVLTTFAYFESKIGMVEVKKTIERTSL